MKIFPPEFLLCPFECFLFLVLEALSMVRVCVHRGKVLVSRDVAVFPKMTVGAAL